MNEPTTGEVVDTSVAVSNSSTTEPTTTPADSQVTENGTGEQTPSTEAPSSASAEQNKSTEGDDNAALAKFAKGQGINDLSELSERELSLLKMARDNKSAFDKTKQNQPKLDESSAELSKLGSDATDVEQLKAKVANMEFAQTKENFFKGKDASLEPVMAQIVADKRQQYGDDYARMLLTDLPTLYNLAAAQKPADTSAAVEEARREERTSINQSLAAGAPAAHATNSTPAAPVKVTNDWIRNEYNPNNPEHRALLDAALKR